MIKIYPFLFAFLIWASPLPVNAQANCGGVAPANYFCGTGPSGGYPSLIPSSPSGGLVVGSTTITSGAPNGLLYDNGGVLGNLATGNNGVLITNGSGVPSISSILPPLIGVPSISGFVAIVQNASITPSTGPNGIRLDLNDSASGGYVVAGYSGTATNQYLHYDGTAASPTAVQLGDLIGREGFGGYDGTSLQNNKGQLNFFAAENWVHNSALGIYFSVFATAKGTTGPMEILRGQASGGLSVGNANVAIDGGSGIIVASGINIGSTPGASCSLSTVSHLTVVNGAVTLCN